MPPPFTGPSATVESAHVYGRELGYVAMSRARHQATSISSPTTWTKPATTSPTIGAANAAKVGHRHGQSGRRTSPTRRPEIDEALRGARLRAERDAITAVIPPDHRKQIGPLAGGVAWTRRELEDLERGAGLHAATPEGHLARSLRIASDHLRQAEYSANNTNYPRAQRRAARHEIVALEASVAAAQARWTRSVSRYTTGLQSR